MNSKNKLAEMPIRPLLYTMAVPLMLSLLIQSLYNRTAGIDKAWFAFWVSEVVACAYSLWAVRKELRNKVK